MIEISFAGQETVLANHKMKNTVFQYLRVSIRRGRMKRYINFSHYFIYLVHENKYHLFYVVYRKISIPNTDYTSLLDLYVF